MTTKQQRTAYNLTKLAEAQEIRKGTEPMFTALYEIAKDAGIAAIDGTNFGIDHFVFVPQKEWDAAVEAMKTAKEFDFIDDPMMFTRNKATHWNSMAKMHEF